MSHPTRIVPANVSNTERNGMSDHRELEPRAKARAERLITTERVLRTNGIAAGKSPGLATKVVAALEELETADA